MTCRGYFYNQLVETSLLVLFKGKGGVRTLHGGDCLIRGRLDEGLDKETDRVLHKGLKY